MNFKAIFTKMFAKSGGQTKHLKAGLKKLKDAATMVDDLQKKAGESKILLAQKQKEAKVALTEITQSMEKKGERKQEVEALQGQCRKDEDNINKRKALVEDELKDVQPLVDMAREAVGDLKAENLNEIKAFRMPPEAVSDVLSGVLMLMGIDDTSWQSMKKFLSQRGVI